MRDRQQLEDGIIGRLAVKMKLNQRDDAPCPIISKTKKAFPKSEKQKDDNRLFRLVQRR